MDIPLVWKMIEERLRSNERGRDVDYPGERRRRKGREEWHGRGKFTLRPKIKIVLLERPYERAESPGIISTLVSAASEDRGQLSHSR